MEQIRVAKDGKKMPGYGGVELLRYAIREDGRDILTGVAIYLL